MMIYRAKQEEKMLKERFVDYTKYKEKVWMFFPKIF
jgi:protein-S-isoprenylcysteine O-methyltransferase Ste14